MGTWNDFLLPSLIINKQGLQTLPLKTYLFFGQFAKRWHLASAGLVMCLSLIHIYWLVWLVFGTMTGITQGFSILVAQFYGAREKENLKCAVAKSYIICLLYTSRCV